MLAGACAAKLLPLDAELGELDHGVDLFFLNNEEGMKEQAHA
jgi:hypothetical protein